MPGRILVALALGGLLLACPAAAQTAAPDADKATLIRELMQVNNALGSAETVAQAMLQHLTAALRQRDPKLPPAVAKIVEEETLATFRNNQAALVTQVSQIYERHFSVEELRDTVAFYRTPTGQKLARTMPVVAHESMQAGQRWAQQITPKLAERIKARAEKEAGYRIQ